MRFPPVIKGAGWEVVGPDNNKLTKISPCRPGSPLTCVTAERLEVTVGQQGPPLVVLHLQHQRHGTVGVAVPSLHGPRHVQADPARLRGVHHLVVQHYHLVGEVSGGSVGSAARALQLQLGHRDPDLLPRQAVRAEFVKSQLGRVDPYKSAGPSGRELDTEELRGDVGNVRQLG